MMLAGVDKGGGGRVAFGDGSWRKRSSVGVRRVKEVVCGEERDGSGRDEERGVCSTEQDLWSGKGGGVDFVEAAAAAAAVAPRVAELSPLPPGVGEEGCWELDMGRISWVGAWASASAKACIKLSGGEKVNSEVTRTMAWIVCS